MRYNFLLIVSSLIFSQPLCAQLLDPKDLDSLKSVPVEGRDAETYYRIGKIYDQLSVLDSGLFYTEKALALMKDEPLEMKVRYLYGVLTYRVGLYSMAQKEGFQALQLALARADTTYIVNCYWLLAITADEAGIYDKSIEYYRRGLEFSPRDEDLLVDLGAVFIKNKDYYNAVGYNQNLLKQPVDSFSVAIIHNNLGDAFLKLGRFDSAYDHIQTTLRYSTTMRDSSSIMYDTYLLGKYYFEVKNYRAAKQCFNFALGLDEKYGDAEMYWTAYELPILYDYLTRIYTLENKPDSVIYIKDKIISMTQRRLSEQQKTSAKLIFSGQEERIGEFIAQQRKSRRALVEYYGIALGIILIVIFYFVFNGLDVEKKIAPYLSVVLLILTFEFLLILLDPLLGNLTRNEPIFSFMANVVIALLLVPVQQYGERLFNKYALEVRLKNVEGKDKGVPLENQ